MPRKARSYNRHLPQPDTRFGNPKYGKFINYLMQRGKKMVAQKIFYSAIDEIERKMHGQSGGGADRGSDRGDRGSEQKADQKSEHKSEQKKISGIQVFDIAIKNVSPMVEIKGRRIGGANYQVPVEVVEPRKTTLGMKWLIAAAQSRKGIPMHQKLAAEILDAYNKIGAAIKKREDTHRMAEANKAFAHFAKFTRR